MGASRRSASRSCRVRAIISATSWPISAASSSTRCTLGRVSFGRSRSARSAGPHRPSGSRRRRATPGPPARRQDWRCAGRAGRSGRDSRRCRRGGWRPPAGRGAAARRRAGLGQRRRCQDGGAAGERSLPVVRRRAQGGDQLPEPPGSCGRGGRGGWAGSVRPAAASQQADGGASRGPDSSCAHGDVERAESACARWVLAWRCAAGAGVGGQLDWGSIAASGGVVAAAACDRFGGTARTQPG